MAVVGSPTTLVTCAESAVIRSSSGGKQVMPMGEHSGLVRWTCYAIIAGSAGVWVLALAAVATALLLPELIDLGWSAVESIDALTGALEDGEGL